MNMEQAKIFLNSSQKAFDKMDQLDYITIQNFCSAKDIIKTMKMQPSVGENICNAYFNQKKLISKTYFKNSYKPIRTRQTTQYFLNGQRLDQAFHIQIRDPISQ